jgi:hypothetical protein
MMPDDILAGIRQRSRLASGLWDAEVCRRSPVASPVADSAMDVPVLAAVIDAVLELHGPGPITILGSGSLCRHHESSRFFSITIAEADAIRACPDCAAATWVSCAGCGPSVDVDECPTRAVIARELTAERGDGGPA